MTFELADRWTWDFWVADDGDRFHLFFLWAPRSLGDPELRHWHAQVGHAVSTDLLAWREVAPAIGRGIPPAYDDRAVWTGSVHRDGSGWRMFRTGLSLAELGPVQRIGCDLSEDLHTWRRDPSPSWPLEADPRWYEKSDVDQHWRDPWVVADDDGVWHMYLTARAAGGGPGRGVVGHAVSTDLGGWDVRQPLSAPGPFEQLEVIQLVEVDGRWAMVFSCLASEMPVGAPRGGGVWSVAVDGPGAPVDVAHAVLLADECLYAGRVVRDRAGHAQLLAFVHRGPHGQFVGGLIDPVPVRWNESGTALTLTRSPVPWCRDVHGTWSQQAAAPSTP